MAELRQAIADAWGDLVGPEGWRAVAWPALFALAALALLIFDHVQDRITPLVFWLCVGLITTVFIWLVETARRKAGALAAQRRLSHVDPVTGLPNRVSLGADLVAHTDAGGRRKLVIVELGGLQAYYDSFGAAAGDELVLEMAARLVASLEPVGGRAYRLDSSRFAVLTSADEAASGETILASSFAQEAARDGEVLVSRSCGEVIVPDEASDPDAALRLAGQRASASKQRQQRSARRQAHAVLMAVLAARRPELRQHLRTVAFRSISVSRRLGLSGEEIDDVFLAAELQDIGMLTVPEAVLEKRGALDESEAMMIRNHPVAGARIVGTAPGLAEVAMIIRAISERYDGTGYPDRLAGDDIPIGARIIAVCVAFAAMSAARPYRAARTVEAAIAELRECAGTQFDPLVVEALAADIEEERTGFSVAPVKAGERNLRPKPTGAQLTPLPGGAGS